MIFESESEYSESDLHFCITNLLSSRNYVDQTSTRFTKKSKFISLIFTW